MRRRPSPCALLVVWTGLALACGSGDSDVPAERRSDVGDGYGGVLVDPGGAPGVEGVELEIPEEAPLVVFLGDSLSAGLHLSGERAFPAVLQARLAGAGRPFRLVNAGVSGDTTAGGLARLDWLLAQEPDIVVVELGANDGLRGLPIASIESNLRAIVLRIREAGARPLLLGMRLPPSYGMEYTDEFAELYGRVAQEQGAPVVRFFMQDVAGVPELNLPDGLHPTAEGHRVLARNLEAPLREQLEDLER